MTEAQAENNGIIQPAESAGPFGLSFLKPYKMSIQSVTILTEPCMTKRIHQPIQIIILLHFFVSPFTGFAADMALRSGIKFDVIGGKLTMKQGDGPLLVDIRNFLGKKIIRIQLTGDENAPIIDRHFIAVQDVSGSMALEDRLANSKTALKTLLDLFLKTKSTSQFSLIKFDDKSEWVIPPQVVTKDNIEALKRDVDMLKAEGGTYIPGALAKAAVRLQQPTGGTVVVLTDGQDSNNIDTLQECERLNVFNAFRNNGNSLSVIALGKDVNFEVLQGLATKARGFHYPLVDTSASQQEMWGMLAANLSSTVATEVTVTVTFEALTKVDYIYPKPSSLTHQGNSIVFTLPSLAQGETKDFSIIVNGNAPNASVQVETNNVNKPSLQTRSVLLDKNITLEQVGVNFLSNAAASSQLKLAIAPLTNADEMLMILEGYTQMDITDGLKKDIEALLAQAKEILAKEVKSDTDEWLKKNVTEKQRKEVHKRFNIISQTTSVEDLVRDLQSIFTTPSQVTEFLDVLNSDKQFDTFKSYCAGRPSAAQTVKMLAENLADSYQEQTASTWTGTQVFQSKAQKSFLDGLKQRIMKQVKTSTNAFNMYGNMMDQLKKKQGSPKPAGDNQ
jgi:hypothetical protein